MTDISKTIIPKSDQLNFDDLLAGPRTITVTEVTVKEGKDQPVWIYYHGDEGKPYKPAKSMRRVILNVWGPESQDYVGRSMTIFGDPTVKWAGKEVGGIRISHMSHIDRSVSMPLTVSRGRRDEYTVKPLSSQPIDDSALIKEGEAAANRGVDVLMAFWKRLSRPEKVRLQQYKDAWKQTAQDSQPMPHAGDGEEGSSGVPSSSLD